MDKDDLDKKLAERIAEPVKLERKINAHLKEDLELLDTQLIQSEIQAKIDRVVGWYNDKCNELGFPSNKIRICEVIEPVFQKNDALEFVESYNYNLHHSLMSAEMSEDNRNGWLEEFESIEDFKIQVTCKADKDNSEHHITYQDEWHYGSILETTTHPDEITVVSLSQRLEDTLMPRVIEMQKQQEQKRIEESETPSYKWGIEYLKNLLGKK
jgi:hypothetical protein